MCSLAYSPDGRTLATGGSNGNVKLWDAASGLERATFQQSGITCLAFSPDGETLAVGGWGNQDATVKLWDLATGSELAPLPGDLPSLRSVTFSHDGKTLAAGTEAGSVFLWDVAGRQLKHKFQASTPRLRLSRSRLMTNFWPPSRDGTTIA